jgi:hypothetical protein
LNIDFPKDFKENSRILPITIYWQSIQKTGVAYKLSVKIRFDGNIIYKNTRFIGSNIYPTDFWRKNQYIKDSYFHLTPHLRRGEYVIEVSVYNSKTGKKIKCAPSEECQQGVIKKQLSVQ